MGKKRNIDQEGVVIEYMVTTNERAGVLTSSIERDLKKTQIEDLSYLFELINKELKTINEKGIVISEKLDTKIREIHENSANKRRFNYVQELEAYLEGLKVLSKEISNSETGVKGVIGDIRGGLKGKYLEVK